jgi:predicted 3-demethylubiquinone-9 3-methyltransferase (glyoxalase superfamily)
MVGTFQIEGQEFIALNGGPVFKTKAISFVVNCETQEEVDEYWKKLTAGGEMRLAQRKVSAVVANRSDNPSQVDG